MIDDTDNGRTSGANLTETTGTDTRHERNDAMVRADELKDPKQVWKNS